MNKKKLIEFIFKMSSEALKYEEKDYGKLCCFKKATF